MSDEAIFPVRSENGRAALDIFYADFNEINFYVEDEDQENLYHEIFRKIFRHVRIEKIFPLGGKQAVIDHLNSSSNDVIPGFRAYILDRDFDHILGIQVRHPNLFYWDRFCLENYLLEEPALIELVIEAQPKKKRDEIIAKLALSGEIPQLFAEARPLFILFLGVQALGLSLKNSSSPPEAFGQKRQPWRFERNAVQSYKEVLIKSAGEAGYSQSEIEAQLTYVVNICKTLSDEKLVSGKFILSMLFHFIKSRYPLGSMTFDSFVYRLAKNSELESMRKLADRVRRRARAYVRNVAPQS